MGTEVSFTPGPVGFEAEWMRAYEQRKNQGLGDVDLSDVIATGYYASATWLVDGREESRLQPSASSSLQWRLRRRRARRPIREARVRERRKSRSRISQPARRAHPRKQRHGLDDRRQLVRQSLVSSDRERHPRRIRRRPPHACPRHDRVLVGAWAGCRSSSEVFVMTRLFSHQRWLVLVALLAAAGRDDPRANDLAGSGPRARALRQRVDPARRSPCEFRRLGEAEGRIFRATTTTRPTSSSTARRCATSASARAASDHAASASRACAWT